jgi:membrane associated rhomboid family serine protease
MFGAQRTLSLPPLTRTITYLLAINTAVFLFLEFGEISSPGLTHYVFEGFGLRPEAVMHGYLWQLVTYSVLHAGFAHFFFNMFALWMFGAQIESMRGPRYFLELYVAGLLGAAVFNIALSYSRVLGDPAIPTVGASGAIYAVLMAFGVFFGDSEIIMIPLPIAMKAKYFVMILIVMTLALSLRKSNGVSEISHLGGLVTGYFFVKYTSGRGLSFSFSERYFRLRNSYHKWQRKKAAKKFEVYMRQQQKDSKDYFDEYGNFKPPDDPGKKDGGKGGWVH